MARSKINLEPQFLDLVAYGGDGLSFKLVVTDTLGAPIPLTGTMLAQIRVNRLDPGSPVTVFATDLTNAANGEVTLSLTGVQTQTMSDSTPPDEKFAGEWDCQWTPVGEEPITLCQGTMEVLPDVSH